MICPDCWVLLRRGDRVSGINAMADMNMTSANMLSAVSITVHCIFYCERHILGLRNFDDAFVLQCVAQNEAHDNKHHGNFGGKRKHLKQDQTWIWIITALRHGVVHLRKEKLLTTKHVMVKQ
jgi:hypothetical protein